ncbi:alpha-L-rhamnosidase-related protein [Klebsiella pneumoniae]|uniref:alpha-L-rhamnosidase-related protein n=1 Tax=Klebsiella pneumoniae TaxID=573 RepID=UPI0011549DAA|nr:family 78 glycoside hydrolase catalytic domain [Klebsiella pneumoniae]HEN5143182.1 family 78 glycoside hydrolase catalytic domain [Klebsiella pneumoniae]
MMKMHTNHDNYMTAYDIANSLTPTLNVTRVNAMNTVIAQSEPTTLLGYTMVNDEAHPLAHIKITPLQEREKIIIDFGRHVTGYLHFTLGWKGRGNDAPTRLRLVYGEVPSDVAESFYPYDGKLSAGWLPDEVITIQHLPQAVVISKRHAFRYVSIEIQAASRNFGLTFSDIYVNAVSSAGDDLHKPATYDSALWQRIDDISLETLRECMQTCFEDGPRRDQRLWMGDLRLQALTNYISFEQNDLVKRCLYLFAGSLNEQGLMTACVYEKPEPQPGEGCMLDYAALFGPTLADYYQATEDRDTADRLLAVAINQLNIIGMHYVDNTGCFHVPEKPSCFVDWQKGLDKQAAMQGIIIYSCRRVIALAEQLGNRESCHSLQYLLEKMLIAARTFWDETLQCFISGPQRQLSWASQIWLVLADAASRQQQQQALTVVMHHPDAVPPMTPYLYHHMVSALVHCQLPERAKSLVLEYWGAMAEGGVDTYWEAFSLSDYAISPYGSKHINSYCHAWSCTPAYFIRHRFTRA